MWKTRCIRNSNRTLWIARVFACRIYSDANFFRCYLCQLLGSFSVWFYGHVFIVEVSFLIAFNLKWKHLNWTLKWSIPFLCAQHKVVPGCAAAAIQRRYETCFGQYLFMLAICWISNNLKLFRSIQTIGSMAFEYVSLFNGVFSAIVQVTCCTIIVKKRLVSKWHSSKSEYQCKLVDSGRSSVQWLMHFLLLNVCFIAVGYIVA